MSDQRDQDPFRPPEIPTEVCCLHCHQEYESYLIQWEEVHCSDGKTRGFWCCPTPGCDGRGFGFDLLPTDPDYRDEYGGGWFDDDLDDFEDDDDLADIERFEGEADIPDDDLPF